MGATVDPRKVEVYWNLRKRNFGKLAAARNAGISYPTARRIEDALTTDNPVDRTALRAARQHPAPTRLEDLRPEPREALEDFAAFQRRYLGHIATGWQVEAANYIRELLASPDKEFCVFNAPPGVGKSTLMTLDIPAWLICRNRAIRGAVFSNTQNAANKYVHRLKRFLERTAPMKGDPVDVDKGLALDAVTTLGDDYGAFKPAVRDNWSQEQFVVAQLDGMPIDEKEPTWSAFGFDSQYLGMRLDYLVADDVVDKRSIRTMDAMDKMRAEWNDVAERRLDPGGLLVLQGQRLGANDLYRYCADKPGYDPEDQPTDLDEARASKMYHHIVWKGHYEDRCEQKHRQDAPAYPQGCLLDPRRLTWAEMSSIRANDRGSFSVVIQQEDTDPVDVLVKPVWVHGGIDPDTGTMHPGCWDKQRNLCELPKGLSGTLLSYACVDPSAARWWSVQWWVTRIDNDTGQPQERYLMDLHRAKMMAPDLLEWSDSTRDFSGLMDEWQKRSINLKLPITRWIIEKNGCQRFLMQYDFVRRWMAAYGVDIVPHETTANKLDPDKGVQSLQGIWKYGLVRLPGKGNSTQDSPAAGGTGWIASMKLVDEVTHYPDTLTTDCVMAQWFGEYWLPTMVPDLEALPVMKRPSWMKGSDTLAWVNKVLRPARQGV